jgi:hypothetical protein
VIFELKVCNMSQKLRVEVAPDQEVTALVYPAAHRDQVDVTVILGHGAGASQRSDFMMRFATGLAVRGVDAITFNFLYTEQGRRVPDTNNDLEACFPGRARGYSTAKNWPW